MVMVMAMVVVLCGQRSTCKRCEAMGMADTERRRECCEAGCIQDAETSDGSTPPHQPRIQETRELLGILYVVVVPVVLVVVRRKTGGTPQTGDSVQASRACHPTQPCLPSSPHARQLASDHNDYQGERSRQEKEQAVPRTTLSAFRSTSTSTSASCTLRLASSQRLHASSDDRNQQGEGRSLHAHYHDIKIRHGNTSTATFYRPKATQKIRRLETNKTRRSGKDTDHQT
jgi:hypothetical protein